MASRGSGERASKSFRDECCRRSEVGGQKSEARVSLVSALLLVLAVTPLQTGHAAKRDPSDVITIVALGDSLTAGYGLSRKRAWPALVAEKMREAGYEFEVVNAGSSGDTTTGGAPPAASSSSCSQKDRYLHSRARDQRRLSRRSDWTGPLESPGDHRPGARPASERCDRRRRNAAARLFQQRLRRRL